MKKALAIVLLFVIFIIIYFFQSNLFIRFNIAGIKPNLFIIYILFLGLFLGKAFGGSFGIFFGLILDFIIGKKIGINAIILGMTGIMRRSI